MTGTRYSSRNPIPREELCCISDDYADLFSTKPINLERFTNLNQRNPCGNDMNYPVYKTGGCMSDEYDLKKATYSLAKHEAGHWLAAHKLGWDPKEIGIRVPQRSGAHYAYTMSSYRTDLKDMDDVRHYAGGRVKILYSGCYAEHYDGSDFDKTTIMKEMGQGGGAYSDFWKAEEIYFFYYNCLSVKPGWEKAFEPIITDVQITIEMHYDFLDSVGSYAASVAKTAGQEITIPPEILVEIFNKSRVR
ncbi:hypothetical protein R0L47_05635 [Pectobacterium polonicum]|uniref:hypothetical protein n=1 Tax=Pectobacterium polonicum TaxID=2485124 RepID=UPI00375498A9